MKRNQIRNLKKKLEAEQKAYKILEVFTYCLFTIVVVLLAIVIYFIGERANKYDLNNDGEVNIFDLMEERDVVYKSLGME